MGKPKKKKLIDYICPKCKCDRNAKGKRFKDMAAVEHHAQYCNGPDQPRTRPVKRQRSEFDLTRTNLIADDDMPDGAYWAVAYEMGEGPY